MLAIGVALSIAVSVASIPRGDPGSGFDSAPEPAPSAAKSAAIVSNEAAAIRALRGIFAAERRFQREVRIDTNCDGIGEYGYLAELAGTKPMRICENGQPAAGSRSDVLVPPLLPPEFGDARGDWFLVTHHGYHFQMWLPNQTAAGTVPGIGEDNDGGGKRFPPFPDPENGARDWVCYAWPVAWWTTGVRAFCINERGFVLETRNRSVIPFGGTWVTPVYYEAFEHPGDMHSPFASGRAK